MIVTNEVTDDMQRNWSDYDRKIAECHMRNYGMVFLDREYYQPIDDFEYVEDYLDRFKPTMDAITRIYHQVKTIA